MTAKPLSKRMVEKHHDKIFEQAPAGALICVKTDSSFLYYTLKQDRLMVYVQAANRWDFSCYDTIAELLKGGDWVYLVEKQQLFPE